MKNEVYKKVCPDCGEVFYAETKLKRKCPECRKTKKDEYAKKHREQYKKPVAERKSQRKPKKKTYIAPDMKRCKKCFYGAILDGNYQICDYITIEGHSRPCLPGADCTEFKPKGEHAKRKRPQMF